MYSKKHYAYLIKSQSSVASFKKISTLFLCARIGVDKILTTEYNAVVDDSINTNITVTWNKFEFENDQKNWVVQ